MLEALCDALADVGQVAALADVFTTPDPLEALDAFVAAFARFWAADGLVMRRLRALAALDPEVAAVITARDERARTGLAVLVGRITPLSTTISRADIDETVRILHTLISFETFDALAGTDSQPTDVAHLVTALTRTVANRQS